MLSVSDLLSKQSSGCLLESTGDLELRLFLCCCILASETAQWKASRIVATCVSISVLAVGDEGSYYWNDFLLCRGPASEYN